MIDLDKLKRSAAVDDGSDAVVSRGWLKQVEQELIEGRAAKALVRQNRRIGKLIVDIEVGAVVRRAKIETRGVQPHG